MSGTIAVGFFDGVHLGHQAILKGADVALTFVNHPLSLLAPARAPRLVMSWEERAKTILSLGVRVTSVDFGREFANYSPERFLALLKGLASTCGGDRAAALSVRCGENWRFGRDGGGDAAWLRRHGVAVTVVPAAEYEGERISSTRIRAALESGEIGKANAMMGRPFRLYGRRFAGKGKGRELGSPTLNIGVRTEDGVPRVRIPNGVYEVEVCGTRAIANYGVAPTFADRAWKEPVLEIHVPNGTGAELALFLDDSTPVSLLGFLRPERTFGSVEELRRQIAADCATIGT